MFRHELSDFLRDVLDAVADLPRGVSIHPGDIPDIEDLEVLAYHLEADPEKITQALEGLRAAHCLVEASITFPGTDPLVWWVVHPQCAPTRSGVEG